MDLTKTSIRILTNRNQEEARLLEDILVLQVKTTELRMTQITETY